MEKQHGLAVQEYRADVFVGARRLLRASRHPQRSQKTRDQHFQLADVFFFGLDHTENETGGWQNEKKNRIKKKTVYNVKINIRPPARGLEHDHYVTMHVNNRLREKSFQRLLRAESVP